MSRTANSGLCCARGIEEFETLERARGYQPPRLSKRAIASRPRPAPIPTREQRNPRLNHATSLEWAKAQGTVAAQGYGWRKADRDSAMPEPGLAAAVINSSGANPSMFRTAPAPVEAEPYYYEPGINFESWGKMPQTGHGRLPPPPEKPLPVPPLRTHKILRKGVASQEPSRRRRGDTQVSPLSSPVGPWSPVSPTNAGRERKASRSDMSLFRAEVDELAGGLIDRNSWEPMPEMRSRYRY